MARGLGCVAKAKSSPVAVFFISLGILENPWDKDITGRGIV